MTRKEELNYDTMTKERQGVHPHHDRYKNTTRERKFPRGITNHTTGSEREGDSTR